MNRYLIKFLVKAKNDSSIYTTAESVTAFCLIKSVDLSAGLAIAKFEVEKDGWEVIRLIMSPEIAIAENFEGKNIGLEQFRNAEKYGRAILYLAVDDRVSEVTIEESTEHDKVDIGGFYTIRNQLAKKGKCNHFNAGEDCDSIINAHSIQKNQSLSVIAKDGHVYALADKVECDGSLSIQKKSIHKFSTFKGFCKHHDNLVFEPIDNHPLKPNLHQAALYAYRSICREMYVKENALKLLTNNLNDFTEENRTKKFVSDLEIRTKNGLMPRFNKKNIFDQMLREESYQNIKYVVLECKSKPILSFTGLFYPEFDFQGRVLQDISRIGEYFSLMTFCFAPTSLGWGVIFSWHQSDDYICIQFIESLKELLRDGKRLDEAIFRLIISTCENVAYSPDWWEHLDDSKKNLLIRHIRFNSDPWVSIKSDYLASGLEGIVSWNFENVYSSYESKK